MKVNQATGDVRRIGVLLAGIDNIIEPHREGLRDRVTAEDVHAIDGLVRAGRDDVERIYTTLDAIFGKLTGLN